MQERDRFEEILRSLIEIRSDGVELTESEIREAFAELQLEPEKINMVLGFLLHTEEADSLASDVPLEAGMGEETVLAEGASLDLNAEGFPDGDQVIAMYLEELKTIPKIEVEEEDRLLAKIAEGDGRAKERLIEGHLHTVVETALRYQNRGIPVGDLIQEGNLALLYLVEEYGNQERGSINRQVLEAEILRGMKGLLTEQSNTRLTAEKMAAKANELMELSTAMAEDLGREATPAELAAQMKMTEDEVKEIMKLSLDALYANQNPS